MTRKKSSPSSVPASANLSPEQMRSAIPKLERRMRELEELDPDSLEHRGDPRLVSLENKLEDTLSDIFGHGTLEFNRFRPTRLDTAGFNVMQATPMGAVIRSVHKGKEREISNLRTIVELFEEKLEDSAGSPASRARRAFGDIDVHPEVARACGDLFANEHYAEAVEAACKVLDLLVKMRSMRSDPSGTELMQLVFSPKSPILKFNEQLNDSERSEQQGMMFLFAGAMLAIRNPRAHSLVDDDPETAIAYISFISMLAKALDRADL